MKLLNVVLETALYLVLCYEQIKYGIAKCKCTVCKCYTSILKHVYMETYMLRRTVFETGINCGNWKKCIWIWVQAEFHSWTTNILYCHTGLSNGRLWILISKKGKGLIEPCPLQTNMQILWNWEDLYRPGEAFCSDHLGLYYSQMYCIDMFSHYADSIKSSINQAHTQVY